MSAAEERRLVTGNRVISPLSTLIYSPRSSSPLSPIRDSWRNSTEVVGVVPFHRRFTIVRALELPNPDGSSFYVTCTVQGRKETPQATSYPVE